METTCEHIGPIAIVTLPGDQLASRNVQDFKQELNPILVTNKQVVLDMSQVRFIDSAGLGAILSYLRHLHDEGGDMKLCGLTQPVRVLFELVRLHRIFEIFNTPEEALHAFEYQVQRIAPAA